MNCLHCGHEYEGNFCPNCGKRTAKKRYSAKRFAEDTIDTLEIKEGLFQTLWLLIKSPGLSIRGHIMGQSTLYNPLKLLLIFGAISTYCTIQFYSFDDSSIHVAFLDLYRGEEMTEYSARYFTFTNIVGIPLFALASWWIFAKAGYNYFEHLILNTYLTIYQLIFMILASPFFKLVTTDQIVNFPLLLIINLYLLYGYSTFFKAKNSVVIPKSILVMVVGYVCAFFGNYTLFLLIPEPVLELFEIF